MSAPFSVTMYVGVFVLPVSHIKGAADIAQIRAKMVEMAGL